MAVNPNMPVLIVDDYKTMIRIIRNLLKQLGFANVDEAGDGTAALDMMRNKQYGLVISDWNMEPMTGYECAPTTGCRVRPSSWSRPNRRRRTSSPPRRPG